MSDSTLDPREFATAFKTFIDAMTESAERQEEINVLLERVKAHLGDDLSQLPVVGEQYDDFEHPNLQRALDAYVAEPGRRAEWAGVGAEVKQFMGFGLATMLSAEGHFRGPGLTQGPVEYINVHLADDEILPCVDLGLLFLHDGDTPLLALVMGASEHGPRQQLSIEVAAHDRSRAQAFLSEITALMDAHNVYRGQMFSLGGDAFGPGRRTLISFRQLPSITRDDVILPEGVLDRIERETVGFATHSEQLQAAGQSLKRGLLLYGAPGVGKTLTVEYLSTRMRGRTVILVTGAGMGLLQPAIAMARKLAPAMVVLEDVDLIAEERGNPFARSGPLLVTLLNEMDGLQNDCDIIFVLTTNRPETLEPALAARPGRIDLAVEFPVPDMAARLRLLHLYARGLDLREVDLDAIAGRTEGATPAFIKELLRKAAVLAVIESGVAAVTQAHLDTALGEMEEGGRLAQRLLGLVREGDVAQGPTRSRLPGQPQRGWISYTELSDE